MALLRRTLTLRRIGLRLASLTALALAGTVLAACEAFIQTVEPTPTLITRTESVRQRPMVPVTRGQLIEAIRTTARVEALDRTELAFKADGRVKTMYVAQGDEVKQGDILAELETGRLDSDIESSQEALQNAELRLDAARTRARDERAAAQRAVANAELALENQRKAFDQLLRRATAEQVEALDVDLATREDRGNVDLSLTEAEAAVVRAQRAVTNAEGGLAEVKAEAAGVVSEAQAQAQAQATLDGLQADLTVATENLRALEAGTVSTGASPEDTARAQVDAAIAAVTGARSAVVRADQDLVNAQNALETVAATMRAQTRDDSSRERAAIVAKRAAIVAKRAEVSRLAETLHEVTFQPFPHVVEAAEQDLEKARLTRDEITNQSSRASAQAKQRAELDFRAAQQAYNEAIMPATPAEIATAQASYDNALAALDLLETELAELLDDGTEEEEAEQLVQKALAEHRVDVATATANVQLANHRLREAEISLDSLVGSGTIQQAIARIASAIQIDQNSSLAAARARVQAASARIDQYLRGQTEAEALARQAGEIRTTSLTALPDAEAALEAALADLRVAEARFQEVTGAPSLATLRVALNNEEAALLEFDATVENFDRFERGESATDFELQILENEVERSRIALEALLTQSEDNVIRAPFDGVITFTRGRAGSQARAFNEVIGIADPSDLIIEVRIAEQDQSKMSVGQPAEVALDAFPGVKFGGNVSAIPRTIVTQTGQTVRIPDALVKVDFEGQEVRMGMLARVNITLQVKDDVLKIPVTSLRDLNERTFVETVVNEQRRSLPVVTGIRSDSEIEVLSGLDEGQMIFAAP
ncbi:MAG: HlyD family efflux transporter periplasmic adaptor subunit [Chloroflexota bacterium]|nr:HlyD family efflux transporter periplasmic adaptor subunit [Chloroflexota bacterium]MDE2918816.1 HlyD family efflux transporter periplasmic adaptor subunit [Chloroflexota bacterium]